MIEFGEILAKQTGNEKITRRELIGFAGILLGNLFFLGGKTCSRAANQNKSDQRGQCKKYDTQRDSNHI